METALGELNGIVSTQTLDAMGKGKKKPWQKDPYLVIARLQPARAAANCLEEEEQ